MLPVRLPVLRPPAILNPGRSLQALSDPASMNCDRRQAPPDVSPSRAGPAGEGPLRPPAHPAGPAVVGRVVPGAPRAAVRTAAPPRQVSAEVPAPAGNREVAPAGVPDGIAPRAHHLARREVGRCANPLLCAHRASFRGSADPACRYQP